MSPQNQQLNSPDSKPEKKTKKKKKKKENQISSVPSPSSLRWEILRQAFLSQSPPTTSPSPSPPPLQTGSSSTSDEIEDVKRISRKTSQGFNLIQSHHHLIHNTTTNHNGQQKYSTCLSKSKSANGAITTQDVRVSYTLPLDVVVDRPPTTLVIRQRVENHVNLNDFEICNRYDIDNTGLICNWPSEEVLAYFCLSHADMFRSKRVLELGAGYGLAGLVIAAATDALEVLISDGNPQVVDYIQQNIKANSAAFSKTKVNSMLLHWNEEQDPTMLSTFDIIVASDCTFFKEFHEGLARTVKSLLKHSAASEAVFLSPKRGNSLDTFLERIKEIGLHFNITEEYDKEVWRRHQKFLGGNDKSWPNYEKDHSYPLLIRITF